MAGEGDPAALQVIVQNLIDLTKNEMSLIRGLGREAQNLMRDLNTIQQFLNDAETHTIPSEDVKTWLLSLENAAFKADNVLDHLCSTILKTKINKKKVPICFSPFIRIRHRRKMVVTIKEINMDLKYINRKATEMGLLKKLADAPTEPYAGAGTDTFSADPIFIGRDEVVSDIVETLITSVTTDERVFSILPIVGMGGVGKTTLTRRVFHHEKMETQFGSRIWVHVSPVFYPINLFNKILRELIPSHSDHGESREDILKKLQQALKDKTYLLVLDDVWNQDGSKWEEFMNFLSEVTTTKGNGIIVTTRNTDDASLVGSLPIHHLEGLSQDDCWSIIKAETFGNEDVPSDFEYIGRKIAKSCDSLPLAASVVGRELCGRMLVDEWLSIGQDWLSQSEGGNPITKILKLSFDYLSSPSLKKCFAYCSIFPKGELMVKEELIEMWMAEGFLGSIDMESVGHKFYNVLLHSSLLQVAKRKKLEHYEMCVMKDVVHDLASFVLGSSNNADGISQVRYLFHECKSSPIEQEVAEHLRTLIFRADQLSDNNIFSDFKYLHVLILKGKSIEEFPTSIMELIQLRNLNISHTKISDLPKGIDKLFNLQTLRAGPYLKKLPSTIKYLINLRQLHVHISVKLPAEIGRLTYLQTLPMFVVGDTSGYKIEELGSLKNLKGSLMIRCLEKVHDKEEAEKANLFEKSKLSRLWLEWNDNIEEVERNDEHVLEGLHPHTNLKELLISGFDGKRLPEWTLKMAVRNELQGSWVGLNQLMEISFYGCRKCEEVPMLGHLPNLKSLEIGYLSNVKSINSSFYGTGKETGIVFPALERLSLSDMSSLKEWAEAKSDSTSEEKVFPKLQSLKISNCNELLKAPIHFSSCLKSLYISGTTDNYLSLLIIYMGQLTSLTYLVLEGLNGLESLPDELFYNNPNLSDLEIRECPKLREIPDGLQTLNSLKKLIIKKCPDLKRIGCSSGGNLTSLSELEISECHKLMDLPYEMVESAPVLKKVVLKGLSSLENLSMVIECLAKSAGLTEMRIVGVPNFMTTSVKVRHCPELLELHFAGM